MVTLTATLEGNKPQEQTDFLSLSSGGQTRQIAAYSRGNGYVKLFSTENFINFYYPDKVFSSVDISSDLYSDETELENILKNKFLQTV